MTDFHLDVIYEDNHLLVVNKPAGLLTQPSGTDQDSLETYAKAFIKQKYQKPGLVYLHAAHRIDKAASGIVVFARTSKALSRLNAAMRAKEMEKIYFAMVEGVLKIKDATLEHYLIHDDYSARAATKAEKEAKLSRLHYQVWKEIQGFSLLKVFLETGRYHQIRCQLGVIGHPIIGDHKYGSIHPLLPHTIALHHARMEINHPVKNEKMVFEAPFPDFWRSLPIQNF